MKALSIQQPWAWAIMCAGKDVENRSWSTDFRGAFLIHAGRKFDNDGFNYLRLRLGACVPMAMEFPRGGIIGHASITGCVQSSASNWFFGPHGFLIANARPLRRPDGMRVIPFPGQRGRFFDVPDAIVREAA